MIKIGVLHSANQAVHAAGVGFTKPPTHLGPVTIAVFDDTCGNLIQINQRH